jgi:hypothetical protein
MIQRIHYRVTAGKVRCSDQVRSARTADPTMYL